MLSRGYTTERLLCGRNTSNNACPYASPSSSRNSKKNATIPVIRYCLPYNRHIHLLLIILRDSPEGTMMFSEQLGAYPVMPIWKTCLSLLAKTSGQTIGIIGYGGQLRSGPHSTDGLPTYTVIMATRFYAKTAKQLDFPFATLETSNERF